MLLALATLVLLPGLLVVRAPWTAVPALSLAFWTLSAWWPPLASAPRGRVALGALVVFVSLLALRFLPKHELPPPPGTPPRALPNPNARSGLAPPAFRSFASLAVAAVALAVALPGLAWRNAPGGLAAFQTTAARVVLWRDGIPASLEPLLPLEPFGAHAPALATLAADLAHLSGGDPAPSVALVLAAAAATALVGLFALYAAWAPPRVAATGALLGLALLPWPAWLSAWGAADAVLALAFLLPAVALATAHASRSSAVASGFLLAAGALAQPVMAVGALAAAILVARLAVRPRPPARRLALVATLALAFGLPGLLPLLRALSWSEAVGVGRALRPGEAAWCAAGLSALSLGALAARLLTRAGRRVETGAALVAAALLVARVHGWMAAGELPLAARDALERAALTTAPLQPLCAPGPPLADWVPAIAARPAGEPGPWVPPVYRDEWDARPRRPCVPFPR